VRLDLADMPNGLDQVEFARQVFAPGTEIHTATTCVSDERSCPRWPRSSTHNRRTSTAQGLSASSGRCRNLDTRTRAASAVQPILPTPRLVGEPRTEFLIGPRIVTPADRTPILSHKRPQYCTQADMQEMRSNPLDLF